MPSNTETSIQAGEGTLAELVATLVSTHHAFTRDALSRLLPLMAKVLRVHGERHPELARSSEQVRALDAQLRTQMEKEERELFPFICALEKAEWDSVSVPKPAFGTVKHPIAQMTAEHASVGLIFKVLGALTGGYVPPADGCSSFRALYEGLAALERDFIGHVHLEDDALFPRAQALEQRLSNGEVNAGARADR